MQYIQLQPQLGSGIPLPSSDNVNYYIDTTDFSLKTKDYEGNIYSSYNALETLNLTSLRNLISNSGLTTGKYYIITETNSYLYNNFTSGGTTVILVATSNTTLSSNGWGLFYNPKYSNPYASVTGYTVFNSDIRLNIDSTNGIFNPNDYVIGSNGQTGTIRGIAGSNTVTLNNITGDWSQSSNITGSNQTTANINGVGLNPSYAIGSKVIYGGGVWVNTSGNVGSSNGSSIYNLTPSDWFPIQYNTIDYNLVCDIIEYDITHDLITYRYDSLKNIEVKYSHNAYQWFEDYVLQNIPWGHPFVYNLKMNNAFVYEILNFSNDISFGSPKLTNISIDDYSSFSFGYFGLGVNINYLNIGKNSAFKYFTIGDRVYIQDVNLFEHSYIFDCSFANNDSEQTSLQRIYSNGGYIQGLDFYTGSRIQDISLDTNVTIQNITLYYNASIQYITIFTYGFFQNMTLYPNSYIDNVNIKSNAEFSNVILTTSSFINNVSIDNGANMSSLNFVGDNSSIQNIKLDNNAYLTNLTIHNNAGLDSVNIFNSATFSNVTLNTSSSLSILNIGQFATFSLITLSTSSSLSYLNIGQGANIYTITLNNNVNFIGFNIGSNSQLNNFTVQSGITINVFTVGDNISPSNFSLFNYSGGSIYYSDLEISKNINNLPLTLDITNSGVIDLSSNLNYGLITLTSTNTGETITNITNTSNRFPKTFRSDAVQVTFVGAPYNGAGSGQIIMSQADYILNSPYDYFKITDVFGNGGSQPVKEIERYNYL